MAATVFVFGRASDDLLAAQPAPPRSSTRAATPRETDVWSCSSSSTTPVDRSRRCPTSRGSSKWWIRSGTWRTASGCCWVGPGRTPLRSTGKKHADLVGAFLDGKLDFKTLVSRMADVSTPKSPKHSRGGFHNLCHRVHLC